MTRLDIKAITEYGQNYSHKLCNNFFSNKDTISGAEIMNISTVDQVNLIALKTLYESWKSSAENFKSPYFDFENEKVKSALQDFMNVTSQHIVVKKADIQPILAKAISDTLSLSLDPIYYFDSAIRDMADFKCTKGDLDILKKYTKINSSIATSLSAKLADEPSVFTNQALKWLEELNEPAKFDDADIVLNQLNSQFPLTKNQFFKTNITDTDNVGKNGTSSFFDNIQKTEAPIIENTILPIEEPKKEEIYKEVNAVKVEIATTLNDQYQSNEPTLNDNIKNADSSQSLVDIHQNSPIKNLTDSISLNQKFVFINKLFNGDSVAFNDTINILEQCKDSAEAINLLKYKYWPNYHWNLNNDEAEELIDILKRKL